MYSFDYIRCKLQSTDDCVSGKTVKDFGVGYDFKSIMHYNMWSHAIDQRILTMLPQDENLRNDTEFIQKSVGFQTELSEMDIKKLNYAYFCEAPPQVK